MVVHQFSQAPAGAPLDQTLDERQVFRAAVRALGSNNRSWATFLRHEGRLADALGGYDPEQSYRAFCAGELSIERIKACLPGQTSTADARGIRDWADFLYERPAFYKRLQKLGAAVQQHAQSRLGRRLEDSRLLPCIVGLLAGPCSVRQLPEALVDARKDLLGNRSKLPAMGYILASEFFRNLHWNAYKPDRHVQRLFDRWMPDARTSVKPEVQELQNLLGCRAAPLTDYLTYSLIGYAVTPADTDASHADNLVWLLGAYVEKRGRESSTEYIR